MRDQQLTKKTTVEVWDLETVRLVDIDALRRQLRLAPWLRATLRLDCRFGDILEIAQAMIQDEDARVEWNEYRTWKGSAMKPDVRRGYELVGCGEDHMKQVWIGFAAYLMGRFPTEDIRVSCNGVTKEARVRVSGWGEAPVGDNVLWPTQMTCWYDLDGLQVPQELRHYCSTRMIEGVEMFPVVFEYTYGDVCE